MIMSCRRIASSSLLRSRRAIDRPEVALSFSCSRDPAVIILSLYLNLFFKLWASHQRQENKIYLKNKKYRNYFFSFGRFALKKLDYSFIQSTKLSRTWNFKPLYFILESKVIFLKIEILIIFFLLLVFFSIGWVAAVFTHRPTEARCLGARAEARRLYSMETTQRGWLRMGVLPRLNLFRVSLSLSLKLGNFEKKNFTFFTTFFGY